MKITHHRPIAYPETTAVWQGDLTLPFKPGRFRGTVNKSVEVSVPVGPDIIIVEVTKQDLLDMLAMLP